jgi:hypothetical protein
MSGCSTCSNACWINLSATVGIPSSGVPPPVQFANAVTPEPLPGALPSPSEMSRDRPSGSVIRRADPTATPCVDFSLRFITIALSGAGRDPLV